MPPTLLRRVCALLLGLVVVAVAGVVATAPGSTASAAAAGNPFFTAPPLYTPGVGGPVRLMALGDSITSSPGCWRALLHQTLVGYGNEVDMVGTQTGGGCGVEFDADHEGHPGALVTDVAASGESAAWFAAARPQVVLLHFATNDVWSGRSTASILDAWTVLVEQARAVDPSVVVVAGMIVPVAPPGCAECPERTRLLNQDVPLWASQVGTPQSPVLVQDHATGWDPAVHTTDGVHPNEQGTARLATTMASGAMRALPLAGGVRGTATPGPILEPLPSTTPSLPSTTPPRPSGTSTSSTPTPVQDRLGCTATYTVSSAWPGGFVATVRVTNDGTFSLGAWEVGLGLPAGEVAHAWSATATAGSPTTFAPVAWNAGLGVGRSTEFGFVGAGDPAAGTVTCRAR